MTSELLPPSLPLDTLCLSLVPARTSEVINLPNQYSLESGEGVTLPLCAGTGLLSATVCTVLNHDRYHLLNRFLCHTLCQILVFIISFNTTQ